MSDVQQWHVFYRTTGDHDDETGRKGWRRVDVMATDEMSALEFHLARVPTTLHVRVYPGASVMSARIRHTPSIDAVHHTPHVERPK